MLRPITVFLSLSSLCCFGQRLSIYLNTNDCINCTSTISLVEELPKSIQVSIYADESKRRFIPELLGKYMLPDSERWTIQYIGSNDLLKLAPISSECVFITPEMRELHFPLKEIGENMEVMGVFDRSYVNTLSLPLGDTLKLSDRIFLETGHGEILLGDYLLGGLYAFKLALPDTVHARQINLGEQLKRAYLGAIGQNMMRYDSLSLLLKSKGMDGIAVTNANWCLDTLYLYANIHYPDKVPEDTSMVIIQNYPVFFKMVADTVFDWRRCDWRLPDSMGRYAMDPEFGFYCDPRGIFIRLADLQHGVDGQLLGDFHYADRSIGWSHFADVLMPSGITKHRPKDAYDMSAMHGGIFMLKCYPFFHDVPRNQTFDLSEAIHSVDKAPFFEGQTIRYWTDDAHWMNKDVLMLLYTMNKTDKTWLVWVDVNADRIVRRVPIATDDVIKSTLHLLDDGRVIGVSKTYDAFIIKQ